MAEARSVVDVIADAVVERLQGEVERHVAPVIEAVRADAEVRIGAVVDQAQTEAQRVLADLISTDHLGIPYSSGNDSVPAKADARDRAKRTLLQGAVATVFVAGMLALAGAVGAPGFDFLDAGSWKTVAGTALGAMLMAGAAYVQRIVNPPKGS